MEAPAILAVLDSVRREVIRREAGDPSDPRFDLALDVLGDLSDALAEPSSLARTLASDEQALD